MSIDLVQQRLLSYSSQTVLDQDNALKEIMQEIALLALSRAGFFRVAAFQGGTCLRILYGLERFSEDLDFVLDQPNNQFDWTVYLKDMADEFSSYGFSLEINDRKKWDGSIRSAFIKTDSVGGILIVRDRSSQQIKLKIKLEVDTNPPGGSDSELKYLDFPMPFSIKTQDLPSLFASKSHALLCRKYVKGRDWYDFIWYVRRQTMINFNLLTQAIDQAGSWKGQKMIVTPEWFLQTLKTKIMVIDWEVAKKDVVRFLRAKEAVSLDVWSTDFFLSTVEKMERYLKNQNG